MPHPANIRYTCIFSIFFVLVCSVFPNSAIWALPIAVEFSAESVERDGVRLEQVNVQMLQQGLSLKVEQASLEAQKDIQLNNLQLQCPELGDEVTGWCPAGD